MRKHMMKWMTLLTAALMVLTFCTGAAAETSAETAVKETAAEDTGPTPEATENRQETAANTGSTAEATENVQETAENAGTAAGRSEAEQAPNKDDVLSMLYAAGEQLLMATENVTMKGEAEFFLDDASFKKASGMYIQDWTDAFQQIDLSGRDTEGTERKTGYAVLDLEGDVTSSEIYHQVDHRTEWSAAPRNTILEGTRNVLQVLRLGRAAARMLEQSPAVELRTEGNEGGRKITMTIGETAPVPEVLQSALNLLWQEGIARYYVPGYTKLYPADYASIEDWGTPTMGIVMTTGEIDLYHLYAEAETDAEGRITSLAGDAAFQLWGGVSGEHDLKIRFSLEVTDYYESKVRDNPEVQERMSISNHSYGDMLPTTPVFTGQMIRRAIENDEDAIAYAKAIWQMDSLGGEDLSGLTWNVRPTQNGHISVWGYDLSDLPSHYYMIETDKTGWVYSLRNTASEVDLAEEYWSDDMSGPEWDDYRLKLIDMSLDFAEAINPDDRERIEAIRTENNTGKGTYGVYVPGYGGAMTHNGSMFLKFYGEVDEENARRTKIVFQIVPEFRVVLFNQLNNPLEGGNG